MAAAVEYAATSLVEPPPGHRVLSVRHFEATPPANINQGLIDGDVIATTKEEEWVTKKKTELTTTRQIETRVKRQLVLEDGKVVEDSGPIVSTNTTEDTEKQEHEHTEHRTTGDDPPGEGWLAIPMEGEGAVVKEVRERVVHSKEEKDDLTETEEVKQLGDLSDKAYLESVRSNQDVRLALRPASGLDSPSPNSLLHSTSTGGAVVSLNSTGPRLVHQSSRSRRTVDTEDAQELSRVQNGHVVTETRRTTEHEEERGEDVPEDDGAASEEEREVNHKEGTQRYAHTKEQDLVEFIGTGGRKIGEHMRYSAENVEGETQGDQDPEWESLSTRMQRMRRHQPGPAAVGSPLADPTSADPASAAAAAAAQARKDALTKRPLDFDQEEETRKKETSKWLEHHFGSDSRSSKSSVDEEQTATPSGAHFINVTMKSRPINGTATNHVSHKTPSPQPISPVIKTPVPIPFTPARVFLSSPEPSSEPTSFVNTPPPPPAPILPTSPGRLLLNGRQNSSSSGGSGKNYFQGVTEWSERRNSGVNARQDRVQVLPTGPAHTFNSSRTQTTGYNGVVSQSSARLNGTTSPPTTLNHVKTTSIQSSMNHSRLNGATSPNPSFNSSSRMNGTTSPRPLSPPDRLNGSASPAEYNRPISPPQGYREEVKSWRGRTVSPVRQQPVQSNNRDRRGSVEILQSEQQRVFKESHRSERRGSGDLLSRGSSELRHTSPLPREIEPPPDYSPGRRRRSRHTSSPSPSPPPYDHSRKSNQKTRFADPSPPQKNKSSFGDSLRRFVGKFRSSDEKKQKRKASRSSSSPSRSYRQGLENNNIPSSVSRRQRVGRGESPPNEAVRRGSAEEEVYYSDEEEGGLTSPVPPPRVRQRQPSPSHHHQLDSRLRRENMMEPRRFYLGEDPFGGSIYGREKEYDGVTPPSKSSAGRNGRHHSYRSHRRGSGPDEEHNSTSQTRNVVWHEDVRNKPSFTHQPVTATLSNTSTLGRYSRSTGRLHSQHDDSGYPRSTQTLPRKLTPREEPVQTSRVVTTTTTRTQQQQQLQHTPVTRSSSQWETSRLTRNQPHSGSLINVSFVNNVTPSAVITGPAKPARTYRSSLARSQSFNVTGGNEPPPPRRIFQQQQQQQQNKTSSYYRSNPHLHRLDEASSPLKSPGIISSISRSQKDLNEAIKHEALIEEEESRFSPRIGSRSPAGINTSTFGNNMHETKKKLFMKGLLDRAPELYRTLHGDEAGPVSPSAPHATNTPHRVEYSSSFREQGNNLAPGVRPARTRRSTTSPPTSLLVPTNLHNGDSKTLLSPSQSFRSHTSGTGSNKDYSETVRYTSTSGDPMRPRVTNTVQSFSKKTVASPRATGGVATETIESKETTTVTKSRTRDPQSTFVSSYANNAAAAAVTPGKSIYSSYDQKTPTRNGGVVIEVRPR